jgi:hypothetical protein
MLRVITVDETGNDRISFAQFSKGLGTECNDRSNRIFGGKEICLRENRANVFKARDEIRIKGRAECDWFLAPQLRVQGIGILQVLTKGIIMLAERRELCAHGILAFFR